MARTASASRSYSISRVVAAVTPTWPATAGFRRASQVKNLLPHGWVLEETVDVRPDD